MGRQGYPAVSRKTAWYVCIGWLLSGLVACNSFWGPPEGRAQDFIDTLVTAPTDAQKLRDIANLASGRDPEDLIDGLSTRVALDFLRAQRDQGAMLKFAQGEARRIDDRRRDVTIRVSYRQPGAKTNLAVRFQVRLEKDAQGQWRIARVTGGN
jgi:hypothetical protein